MQRFALAGALIATLLCCEAATPARAEFYDYWACQPFPPGYPRGWELMVRRPCLVSSGYGSYYGPPIVGAYGYRAPVRVGYRTHRRPYLRPGWWW